MENVFCFIIVPILVFCFAFLFFWGLEEAEKRVGKFGKRVLWWPLAVGVLTTIIAVMVAPGFIGVVPLLVGEGWMVLAVISILLTRPAPHYVDDLEVGDGK